jgi:hypothetical protein
MKNGSTLFLKALIILIGLAVLGVCIILCGVMIGGHPGMYIPVMLVMLATAVPFFYALYQGFKLLRWIDMNEAFAEHSVQAIRVIKYCGAIISAAYAISMPYTAYVADLDDAPGVIVIALVFMGAPLVTAVFLAT